MGMDGVGGADSRNDVAGATGPAEMTAAQGWDVREAFGVALDRGIETLRGCNATVERREAELERQIADGYPQAAGLTEAAYRDAARAHPDYAAQQAAVQAVADVLADGLAHLGPAMAATGGVLGTEGVQIEAAGVEIARAAANGAADASVVSALGTAAGHLANGIDLGAALASDLVGARYAALAQHIAGPLGIASSVSTVVDGYGRTLDGTANAGTYMQLAGEAGALTSAALAALGIASRGLGPAGTALSIGGSLYSDIADRQRYQADVAGTLERAGVAPGLAASIAGANADTLRTLADAGVTPDHIRTIATASPAALQQHGDLTRGLVAATGLRGDSLAGLLAAAGPGTGALFNAGADLARSYAPTSDAQAFAARIANDPRGVSPVLSSALEYLHALH